MRCPCCDCPENRQIIAKSPTLVLLACDHCGFVFADLECWVNPYAKKDYYDPDFQPVDSYPLTPTETERDRVRSILPFVKQGKFLDLGGGLGKTALAAREFGFDVTLLEESQRAIENGSLHHPEISWVCGNQVPQDWKKGCYDVVTLFHVLEHIPEPQKVLPSILDLVDTQGCICFEVPNWGSHMRKIKGKDWIYVLDHHVNYFTQQSLRLLLNQFSFYPVSTEFRRTFCINENQRWKEPVKKVLASFGFGDVLRMVFKRK